MPGGDGTGPVGGAGQGAGPGRQPGGSGMGPGGECVCPSCNERVPHEQGTPCYEMNCPKCGAKMTREE